MAKCFGHVAPSCTAMHRHALSSKKIRTKFDTARENQDAWKSGLLRGRDDAKPLVRRNNAARRNFHG